MEVRLHLRQALEEAPAFSGPGVDRFLGALVRDDVVTGFRGRRRSAASTSRVAGRFDGASTTITRESPTMKTEFDSNACPGGSVRMAA